MATKEASNVVEGSGSGSGAVLQVFKSGVCHRSNWFILLHLYSTTTELCIYDLSL